MKLSKFFFHNKLHLHGHLQSNAHAQPSNTLDNLPPGCSGIIVNLSGGKHISSRLASIGLTIGSEVQVLQNYHHGPIIITVRGVRLALGRGEANKIEVKVL